MQTELTRKYGGHLISYTKKSHIEREKKILSHLLVIWQQRYHIPQEKHKEKCYKRMSEEE